MNILKKHSHCQSYQPVQADAQADEEESECNERPFAALATPVSRRNMLQFFTIICLLVSNLILIIALASSHAGPILPSSTTGYSQPERNKARKQVSSYSPILDLYDLKLQHHTFNGALRDNTSIWRQPPSPQVDEAWDHISGEKFQLITVSERDILLSAKDPSTALRAPTAWGVGDDAYIAQVEVFHQIHCLNELRKEMYRDYYYPHQSKSEVHHSHKAHCIHMLLQALMCSSDVGIITHNWVHNERVPAPKTRPMADFNVEKKCADFDGLLEWTQRRAVKDLKKKWPLLKWVPGMKIVGGDGYA